MPITIHVTGFASSAVVKLQTLDISGARAPFANTNPAFNILNAPIDFVITRPTPEITVISVPPMVRKPPRASTTIIMTRTSSWFCSIHVPTFVRTCSPVPMRSLTVGSRVFPMLSVTLWMRCCNRSNRSGSVSCMAEAISCATPVPCPIAS